MQTIKAGDEAIFLSDDISAENLADVDGSN